MITAACAVHLSASSYRDRKRDGFRWHARARDAEDGAFMLERLSGATLLGPAEPPSNTDRDWISWVTLTIARDYGMRGGTVDLEVRKALAYA